MKRTGNLQSNCSSCVPGRCMELLGLYSLRGFSSTLLWFAQHPHPWASFTFWLLVGFGQWQAPLGDRRVEESEVGVVLSATALLSCHSSVAVDLSSCPGSPFSPAVSNVFLPCPSRSGLNMASCYCSPLAASESIWVPLPCPHLFRQNPLCGIVFPARALTDIPASSSFKSINIHQELICISSWQAFKNRVS